MNSCVACLLHFWMLGHPLYARKSVLSWPSFVSELFVLFYRKNDLIEKDVKFYMKLGKSISETYILINYFLLRVRGGLSISNMTAKTLKMTVGALAVGIVQELVYKNRLKYKKIVNFPRMNEKKFAKMFALTSRMSIYALHRYNFPTVIKSERENCKFMKIWPSCRIDEYF